MIIVCTTGEPDLQTIQALVVRLDAAGGTAAVDCQEIVERLVMAEDEKHGPIGDLATAFHYWLRDGDPVFRSVFTWNDGSAWPPPVSEVPDEVVALWAACAERTSSMIARARLHDLCFICHWGIGRDHARAGADAYLALASSDPYAIEGQRRARAVMGRARSLRRALDLARRTGQDDIARRAIEAMLAAVEESLGRGNAEPGVALRLLETLVGDRSEITHIDELLERARTTYPDAFLTAHTIDLQLRRAKKSPTDREQLRREEVQSWIDEADRTGLPAQLLHLERGAQLARDYGFTDLVKQITAALQGIRPEDLGLQRMSTEVRIPREDMERYMDWFTDAEDWQEALRRFAGVEPPTGDVQANRRRADEMAEETPLQAFIPHTRLGSDGLPRFTATTEEEKAEWRLSEQETLNFQLRAPLVAEALRRIGEKWPHIPVEDLTRFLAQHPHVRDPVAASIARGLNHFFIGDHEAATYIVTPRIETLARELVLSLGLGVYRAQRRKTPGQYPGLGTLLPALAAAGMDESLYRYLHTFMASSTGANFRNETLHGFVDEVSAVYAGAVIIGALYLTIGILPGGW